LIPTHPARMLASGSRDVKREVSPPLPTILGPDGGGAASRGPEAAQEAGQSWRSPISKSPRLTKHCRRQAGSRPVLLSGRRCSCPRRPLRRRGDKKALDKLRHWEGLAKALNPQRPARLDVGLSSSNSTCTATSPSARASAAPKNEFGLPLGESRNGELV
jgi:hypothetical protein